ncbi:MAG: KH domain-containing protein [Deltaproteobacteria bacterium]|nr:KH domain-containing protein [Deltaproteobacteria bacterium]
MANDEDRPGDGLDEETLDEVLWFVRGSLERMGYQCAIEMRREGPEAILEIVGEDAGQVIGKKGATLDALQTLANRVARKFAHADERGFVVLDADGYRARQEKQLSELAEKLGNQALRERRTITMEPLSPRDRRVVHMALARFTGVRTQSQGEGTERRLQIIPMAAPRREGDRDRRDRPRD